MVVPLLLLKPRGTLWVGFQARTVRRWMQVAGAHCQKVPQQLVVPPRALGQVQADELRVRVQKTSGCKRLKVEGACSGWPWLWRCRLACGWEAC
jgi:hypothetical protein